MRLLRSIHHFLESPYMCEELCDVLPTASGGGEGSSLMLQGDALQQSSHLAN
jgi:hypothetical protein